jgi:hypothetical protein
VNMPDQFLGIYDSCKRSRTQENCRSVVQQAAPDMIDFHHRGVHHSLTSWTSMKEFVKGFLLSPEKRSYSLP